MGRKKPARNLCSKALLNRPRAFKDLDAVPARAVFSILNEVGESNACSSKNLFVLEVYGLVWCLPSFILAILSSSLKLCITKRTLPAALSMRQFMPL
jgi:hypothetical protein